MAYSDPTLNALEEKWLDPDYDFAGSCYPDEEEEEQEEEELSFIEALDRYMQLVNERIGKKNA